MQPTAQAVGDRNTGGTSPEGAKENGQGTRENSLRLHGIVQACRDPSLRLFFALIAQRPSSLRTTNRMAGSLPDNLKVGPHSNLRRFHPRCHR